MKVVVTGATGNVGTSLLPVLASDPDVTSVVGVARRAPVSTPGAPTGTTFVAADVGRDDLSPLFQGADAVVHLAWAIQPSHDEATLWRANVIGSQRVFRAAAEAAVETVIHASSIGAYSGAPPGHVVDETWPVEGTASSFYARHKAGVEAFLDGFETAHPSMTVIRMRPALIFKRSAATGIRRLFLGPLFPNRALRPSLIPLFPTIPWLSFQAVHSYDVAAAIHAALKRGVGGAFNLASDPLLTTDDIAGMLDARRWPVSARAVRTGAAISWALRLQPTPPGWLDMAMAVPVMSNARACAELGWQPRYRATEALEELLAGLRDGAGFPTPPLSAATGGIARRGEFTGSALDPDRAGRAQPGTARSASAPPAD